MSTETDSLTDFEYNKQDGVVELVLDRPDVFNAFRHETIRDLETARERAEADDDVHGILIRSKGDDAFCTGADLNVIEGYTEHEEKVEQWLTDWHRTFMDLERGPLPVVGCVTGQALAGGLELVLACDVVVAGPNARFGDQHINFDLVAGGNGTQMLPRLVGRRRAKYLILTGKTIDAETGREWGLVNEVSEEPIDAAWDLVEEITEHHPVAIRRSKDLIDRGMDATLDNGLALEREVVLNHLQSDVAKAGIDRFKNR
jgi:enoyl-CoA hydratase/carnithine racemase